MPGNVRWSIARENEGVKLCSIRRLGQLDDQVSAVGFGAASISGEGGGYGFGHISEDDAISLVHGALERGINLFDTAPIYGFGMSERRLGKALRGHRREQVFVSLNVVWIGIPTGGWAG